MGFETANVTSALIGASKPEQVEENVKASGINLSDEILNKLKPFFNSQ